MNDEIEIVRGKRTVIEFEGKKCIHSRGCVLGRPDVFVPNVQGEWIHPDAATADEVAALAAGCPSGAIRYQRLDGGPQEAAPLVNSIRVRENGPLAVSAVIEIDGRPVGFRATFCRCGASQNKPFCDGSHTAAEFVATGEPETDLSQPLAERGGLIKISPTRNGPLIVDGNQELVSGTGRTLNRAVKTALCRCGHSSRKPYCDGTHRAIGFKTE
jgi:CDGSH-type Zn-finger protein/uncharacterized Fe-S cluster protein YjdI